MPLLSRTLTAIGSVLLIHACYSAHEHSSLHAHALGAPNHLASPSLFPTTTSPSPTTHKSSLPLDISLETILSVLLICAGVVLGAEALKPISWRVWAGKMEREGGGPFKGLEERRGFVDIRAKRKEFAEWIRENGQTGRS